MSQVHALKNLTAGPRAELFEGLRHGDGIELSFFVTTTPPDRGPPLHVHPNAEVFLVEQGKATFTIGDDDVEVGTGEIVMVPPETPHRFHNTGTETLRIISMHPNSEVHQANVEPGAPTRITPRQ
jgi:mannose-6-phosphate isomerase-like protein (cupin superfamily)